MTQSSLMDLNQPDHYEIEVDDQMVAVCRDIPFQVMADAVNSGEDLPTFVLSQIVVCIKVGDKNYNPLTASLRQSKRIVTAVLEDFEEVK